MAATNTSLLRISPRPLISAKLTRGGSNLPKSLKTAARPRFTSLKHNSRRFSRGITAAIAVTVAPPAEEKFQECALPSWAMFELGMEPLYWKTTNGLPPTSGERLKLFYNPAATKLEPNESFGFAFNGGFNQSIMCGGQRAMLKKTRGKADSPIYTIQICIPKHAVNLVFSFTNGVDVDGPYRLQFSPVKAWRNKPMEFFNEGLAEELSSDGACDAAIFPDSEIVVDRCSMMANLTVEGGNRCELNLVPGCMDPSSYLYNPLANVDDGSCPLDIDAEPQS